MTLRVAPAAERNKQPIADVLRRVLPDQGIVLEVASGTGQHAAFFSEQLPGLIWQPSDCSAAALESIAAWVDRRGHRSLREPIVLDVMERPWPIAEAAAVLCINMIHIAPWAATEALFDGAHAVLSEGAPLVTYGPYRIAGEHVSQSNQAFDESLRSRDPRWGVRDLEALEAAAQDRGLSLDERVQMPANNFALVWRAVSASQAKGPTKSMTK